MMMKKEEAELIIEKLVQINLALIDTSVSNQDKETARQNASDLLAIFTSPDNKLIYPYNR